MAHDFPNAPADGTISQPSVGGAAWKYSDWQAVWMRAGKASKTALPFNYFVNPEPRISQQYGTGGQMQGGGGGLTGTTLKSYCADQWYSDWSWADLGPTTQSLSSYLSINVGTGTTTLYISKSYFTP